MDASRHLTNHQAQMTSPVRPRIIICADWSKNSSKRAVYMARVDAVAIERLDVGLDPTVSTIIGAAEELRGGGIALIAFDAPLGVPAAYFTSVQGSALHFMEWLPGACVPRFFEPTISAAAWRPEQPFFKIPAGKGSLTEFTRAAAIRGIELKRRVETATRGNSVFAMGIPGAVSLAAQSLWQEIVAARSNGQSFVVWPFEISFETGFGLAPIVLAEIYPRAAYATALEYSKPISLAKTKEGIRRSALAHLMRTKWMDSHRPIVTAIADAEQNEDCFDALLTASALLRLTLERQAFTTSAPDPIAEGGILCA